MRLNVLILSMMLLMGNSDTLQECITKGVRFGYQGDAFMCLDCSVYNAQVKVKSTNNVCGDGKSCIYNNEVCVGNRLELARNWDQCWSLGHNFGFRNAQQCIDCSKETACVNGCLTSGAQCIGDQARLKKTYEECSQLGDEFGFGLSMAPSCQWCGASRQERDCVQFICKWTEEKCKGRKKEQYENMIECNQIGTDYSLNVYDVQQDKRCLDCASLVDKDQCVSELSCKYDSGTRCSKYQECFQLCGQIDDQQTCNEVVISVEYTPYRRLFGGTSSFRCVWLENGCQFQQCHIRQISDLQPQFVNGLECVCGGSNCRNLECRDLQSEAQCNRVVNSYLCQWNKHSKYCQQTELTIVTCEDIKIEKLCTALEKGCFWQNGKCLLDNCFNKYPAIEQCQLSQKNQLYYCIWNPSLSVCSDVHIKDLQCSSFEDATACSTITSILPDTKCTWNPDTNKCHPSTCADLSTPQQCIPLLMELKLLLISINGEVCNYNQKLNQCYYDQNFNNQSDCSTMLNQHQCGLIPSCHWTRETLSCNQLKCKDILDPLECGNTIIVDTLCDFNPSTKQCFSHPANLTNCDHILSMQLCNRLDFCRWNNNVCGPYSCANLTQSECIPIDNQVVKLASRLCDFNVTSQKCVPLPANPICYDVLTEQTCNKTILSNYLPNKAPCFYHQNQTLCYAQLCNIYDQYQCQAHNQQSPAPTYFCDYNSTGPSGNCVNILLQSPCERILSPALCNSNLTIQINQIKCSWINGKCKPYSCDDYYTQTECLESTNFCDWNPAEKLCFSPLNCEEIFTETLCNSTLKLNGYYCQLHKQTVQTNPFILVNQQTTLLTFPGSNPTDIVSFCRSNRCEYLRRACECLNSGNQSPQEPLCYYTYDKNPLSIGNCFQRDKCPQAWDEHSCNQMDKTICHWDKLNYQCKEMKCSDRWMQSDCDIYPGCKWIFHNRTCVPNTPTSNYIESCTKLKHKRDCLSKIDDYNCHWFKKSKTCLPLINETLCETLSDDFQCEINLGQNCTWNAANKSCIVYLDVNITVVAKNNESISIDDQSNFQMVMMMGAMVQILQLIISH